MVSQSTTSAPPPGLSSFLVASREWLDDDYASLVVKRVLDSRDQIPSEAKRALDAAIRSTGVRVPGAQFQHKDVEGAPTHHLQSPVLRKMHSSDELSEAVLRAWVGIQGALYESVVQHLQWNDEPTYGPDRGQKSFRGFWDARDWQTNYNQFLADRTGFDPNDVGLMLWYVSGKLPPPKSDVMDPLERVDFEYWKELLLALRPDAPQWEQALEFAAAIGDIVLEKDKMRARDAVNQLKTRAEDIWLEYSDELVYLEKNIESWAAARHIQPEEAVDTLTRVNNLELMLSQYRPIRDQAQSRSVESSRAGRRAELEAEIISTVTELEPIFGPSDGSGLPELEPATDADASDWEASSELEGPVEVAEVLADASDDTGCMEPGDQCEEFLPGDLLAFPSGPVDLPPAPEFLDTLPEGLTSAPDSPDMATGELTVVPESLEPAPEEPMPAFDSLSSRLEALTPAAESPGPELDQAQPADVNVSILAGLQSLRDDLEQLKEQLSGANASGNPVQEPEPLEEGLTLDLASNALEGSLAAAVNRAREWHSNRLIFRLNSESWVDGNPFEDYQSVSDAFEWMATTYYLARQDDFDHAQLGESLYRFCRWKYSSSQSDGSFFQNEGQYRMLVNGRAYFLNEAIGKGVGDDPVNAIRIAFYWDRRRERVVIGYIGQHQPGAGS